MVWPSPTWKGWIPDSSASDRHRTPNIPGEGAKKLRQIPPATFKTCESTEQKELATIY